MEEAVWSSYIGGEIWRGLFRAVILAEGHYEGWRDLERLVWSSYIGGEIWRELFGAFIIGERSRDAYLELLYWWRDLEEAVWSSYIGGAMLYWRRDIILLERYRGSCLEL